MRARRWKSACLAPRHLRLPGTVRAKHRGKRTLGGTKCGERIGRCCLSILCASCGGYSGTSGQCTWLAYTLSARWTCLMDLAPGMCAHTVPQRRWHRKIFLASPIISTTLIDPRPECHTTATLPGQPRGHSKRRGYALVTLSTIEQRDALLDKWPWKRRVSSNSGDSESSMPGIRKNRKFV